MGRTAGIGATGPAEIQAIQLLRTLAAMTVAVVHLALGFADHVNDGLGIASARPLLNQLGQAGVALFFMVSGYVMIVASAGHFGTSGGSQWFWRRRAVRVLPPYWIATLLLVPLLALHGEQAALGDLLRSLVCCGPIGRPTGARRFPYCGRGGRCFTSWCSTFCSGSASAVGASGPWGWQWAASRRCR